MGSIEWYFDNNGDDTYKQIDKYDEDELDNYLYGVLDNATYTGRIWLDYKIMAFWDLRIDAESRIRLKDIINNLEKEFNIKIDPKEWWLEFSDTTTGIPYFVVLNDFIEGNNLKYGIMDTNNKVSNEVRKAWHLLNSAEKIKMKTQYGMDRWKGKDRPLAWKQALLKSESLVDKMTPVSEEQMREKAKEVFKTDKDIISIKVWNPSGWKLVSKQSGIEEENYRVDYHKLTGDVLKIYNFLVDYLERFPGGTINNIDRFLIDDKELKYIPIKDRNKNESKLNENPDYIGKLNKAFYDEDSLAFGYYNGEMYVNPKLHGDHPELKEERLIRNDFKYPGRLWTDSKVISFWIFPHREEFLKIISDIEEVSDVVFDDEWVVEVVDIDSMGYKDSDFVSFEDYYGSPDWTKTEFEQEHIKSPLLKIKKKPSYIKRKTIEDRLKYTSENKIINKFENYINESIIKKMIPKSSDDVFNYLYSIEVGIDEYIDIIKNGILNYLNDKNINIKDVILIDDLDAVDFITVHFINDKSSVEHVEKEIDDGIYFSFFDFYDDEIIIIGDDSGEINIAIINKNKLKEKLIENIRNSEKNSLSLQDYNKDNDMRINERVEAEMELPQDIINFQKLFDKKGYKLYVVGGAVRDYLMGKKPHDFDMVTDTTPENVMEVLKDYRTDLQGVHFGVVRVFTNDEPEGYEIASYRKDISKGRDTKGADKKVEIGSHITIKDDVRRRDLTMNALFYNIKTGEIVDVVGGMKDIKNKVVRAVGVPQKRFDEDRLRILRALRFAAVTDSELDSRTAQAIKNDSRLFGISDVDDVSRERIFLEFKKVKEKARENNNPRIIKRFVDMLIDYDIMEQIFPVKVLEKNIRPTTYLTVAIAQVLRKNEVTPEFKQILIDSKIPTNFVDIISVLIRLYNNGVPPEDVYELYKEVRNKDVRRDILEEWINIMGIRDKSVIKFLDYVPTTTGKEVMDDGFKGAGIGNEIRKREAEKFKKMLNESVVVESFNTFKNKIK